MRERRPWKAGELFWLVALTLHMARGRLAYASLRLLAFIQQA